jgi:hypothetical protein
MRIIIYMELRVNDYLTWQSATGDNTANLSTQVLEECCPRPVKETLPSWWSKLPGDVNQVAGCPFHKQDIVEAHNRHSAKHCLGLRGAKTLGYSIPLAHPLQTDCSQLQWQRFYQAVRDPSWPNCDRPQDFVLLPSEIQTECIEIHGYTGSSCHNWVHPTVKISELHPEMLHGSIWAEKDSNDNYRWTIILMSWPWRAKMPQGWRLMMTAHPFDWSRNWHAFTGCVDANYLHDGKTINKCFWDFEYPINSEFSYYNVETVVAIDAQHSEIPSGVSLFSMLPVWDPSYHPKKKKPYPVYS